MIKDLNVCDVSISIEVKEIQKNMNWDEKSLFSLSLNPSWYIPFMFWNLHKV